MKTPSLTLRRGVLALVLTGLSCGVAQALPWDGPLSQIQTSLTGTVAKAIGVVALAVSGGMLAFGGELSDFTKRIMMVVLALSVMLMADQFMSLFG